jgi:uncharacterized protein YndB with AHSA1/START domain
MNPPTRTLRMRRRLVASPERVYRAWSDPEELARWLPERIEGGLAVGTESVLVWADRRETWQVIEAQPNRSFAFLRSPETRGHSATTTTVRIDPLGYGSRIEIEAGPFSLDSDEDLDAWGESLQTWAEALAMLRAHLDFSVDLRVRE